MSMRAPLLYIVPEDTELAARASFPKGHLLIRIADEFGLLYANAQFAPLFSPTGQPALDPARLALVTIFQFMEGLSDEQAADAVRGHLAWKYALAVPLYYAGFDASVLSEFRTRLIAGGLELLLLDPLLERLQERGLLKARGRARTDSTHVLAAVRSLSRLLNCGETVRAALNSLAEADPAWLAPHIDPDWLHRYGYRLSEYRMPKSKEARAELAAVYGADGRRLLRALANATTPSHLQQLPAVRVLRAVWVQQFYAPGADGVERWREQEDQPPARLLIVSPIDIEARAGAKGGQGWVGYKVHLTETCDDETPNIITHVETTAATATDEAALAPIHAALAERELLPAEHLVDAGYMDSARLVESKQQHQVRLVGPLTEDSSWQARAGQGYAAGYFAVDWAAQRVICPEGQQSKTWTETHTGYGKDAIHVGFAAATCEECGARAACTKTAKGGRALTLKPQAQHIAMLAQRAEQQSEEYKEEYQRRAGVEGTMSQGVRVGGMRQSRYIGTAKTRLQHILIAVALNLVRVVAWLEEIPRARTRVTAFAALARRQARMTVATAAGF